MAGGEFFGGMANVDLVVQGPPRCGHGWRGSVCGPIRAGRVERLPRGGLRALWHPGLWHILVSEVPGGRGAAEAVGAAVWDPVGGAADGRVGAEVGAAGDEAVGVEDVAGVFVHDLQEGQEAGVWHGEGGVEHGGEVRGRSGGKRGPEGGAQVEAQAGCLE